MLKARNASKGRNETKDKVVKRELCSILSRGTRTYCFLDDVSSTPDGSPRSVNMILSIKVKLFTFPLFTRNFFRYPLGVPSSSVMLEYMFGSVFRCQVFFAQALQKTSRPYTFL